METSCKMEVVCFVVLTTHSLMIKTLIHSTIHLNPNIPRTINAFVIIAEIRWTRHQIIVTGVIAEGVEEISSMVFVRLVLLKPIIHTPMILTQTSPTILKMIVISLLRTLMSKNRVSIIHSKIHQILKIVGERSVILIPNRILIVILKDLTIPHKILTEVERARMTE